MLRINRKFVLSMSILYIVVVFMHVFLVRPKYMVWGATLPELAMQLPGDDEIPANTVISTRAVTINAPADRIWPWIVQIGQDRAGWYSFDWMENLFAANMHNADSIVDVWQTVQIGDQLPFLEGGSGDTFTSEVTEVDPGRALVMEGWTLYLIPIDAESTRLVVRYPGVDGAGLGALYYYPIFEPAHFLMETGMMLGIKQRSEALEGQKS